MHIQGLPFILREVNYTNYMIVLPYYVIIPHAQCHACSPILGHSYTLILYMIDGHPILAYHSVHGAMTLA